MQQAWTQASDTSFVSQCRRETLRIKLVGVPSKDENGQGLLRFPDYACSQIKECDFTCKCTLTKNPTYMQPARRFMDCYVSLSERCQIKSSRVSPISRYGFPRKALGQHAICNVFLKIILSCLNVYTVDLPVRLWNCFTVSPSIFWRKNWCTQGEFYHSFVSWKNKTL